MIKRDLNEVINLEKLNSESNNENNDSKILNEVISLEDEVKKALNEKESKDSKEKLDYVGTLNE